MMRQVIVKYTGGHNFDFDSRLEAIAEKPRSGSGMNFDTGMRDVGFEFDDEQTAILFSAAVKSAFPEFEIYST
jgi:hypothetical protein